MKNSKYFCGIFATVFVTTTMAQLASCSQDDDYYDSDMYTLAEMGTRLGGDGDEIGATQTFSFNSNTPSYDYVPVNEYECALWALITVAKNKKTSFTYYDQTGHLQTKPINENFSASAAYDYAKNVATNRTWSVYDENGYPIDNSDTLKYSGTGDMNSHITAGLAKELGIMEGRLLSFESFQAIRDYISTPEWVNSHPKGTYIILSEKYQHTSVCEGVNSKGAIKIENSSGATDVPRRKYTSENSGEGKFYLIY